MALYWNCRTVATFIFFKRHNHPKTCFNYNFFVCLLCFRFCFARKWLKNHVLCKCRRMLQQLCESTEIIRYSEFAKNYPTNPLLSIRRKNTTLMRTKQFKVIGDTYFWTVSRTRLSIYLKKDTHKIPIETKMHLLCVVCTMRSMVYGVYILA